MKLHIGNLSKAVTETELKDLMTPFGAPASVEIVKDHAGISKGFGFAEFAARHIRDPSPSARLRGCEEILSGVGPRGGSEGSSVTPAGLGPIAQTVRLVAQRGRWFLRRSVGNVDPV